MKKKGQTYSNEPVLADFTLRPSLLAVKAEKPFIFRLFPALSA
jgi:hypothetical protein